MKAARQAGGFDWREYKFSPLPSFVGASAAGTEPLPYRANVWRVLMVQEVADFPDRQLKGEKPVEQAEGCGRPSRIAAHPRLNVLYCLIDLVHNLLPPAGGQAQRGARQCAGARVCVSQGVRLVSLACALADGCGPHPRCQR